jgi:hypothetical protein
MENDKKGSIFRELSRGQTRTIGIRDDTDYSEIVEVRRSWKYPKFDGRAYYDIAVIELGKISFI